MLHLEQAARTNPTTGLTPADQQIAAAYGQIPLSFVANAGQTAPQVQYVSGEWLYRLDQLPHYGRGVSDNFEWLSKCVRHKTDVSLGGGVDK